MCNVNTRTARDSITNIVNFAELNLNLISGSTFADAACSYSDRLKKINREIESMPDGNLHIKQINNKYYFGRIVNKKESGITGDCNLVSALARKKMLLESSKNLKNTICILEKAASSLRRIANCSNSVCLYNRYSESGIDPLSVFFTKEQLNWIDEPYIPSPFHRENLKYYTSGGIPVRSKSEAIFGSRLEMRGIPYRHDDLIIVTLNKDGVLTEKSYYADFKIPNFNGGISVNEHLGAFNFDTYSNNALTRLYNYVETGAVKANELFWSFDSTVNDPQKLDNLINRMLMAI